MGKINSDFINQKWFSEDVEIEKQNALRDLYFRMKDSFTKIKNSEEAAAFAYSKIKDFDCSQNKNFAEMLNIKSFVIEVSFCILKDEFKWGDDSLRIYERLLKEYCNFCVCEEDLGGVDRY